jgi:FMN-dependent NADH-azoreductase
MSRNILLITSSPRGAASLSSKVAGELVARLKSHDPSAKIVHRDLAREPLPHIGEDYVVGRLTPAEKQTPSQMEAVRLSDDLIAELFAADTIVIASGIINFGLPSTLKAWFDYIIRAGKTFRYTPAGRAEGLVTGKKAYLVHARGGIYSEGPLKALDYQEPYLKLLLGFIGVTDVEVVRVEGVALGPEVAQKAVTAALAHVETLSPTPAVTALG